MSDAVVIAIIAGIPGVVGSFLVYKNTSRSEVRAAKAAREAADAQMKQVESGAYERARKLYEDGISQLEQQVERFRRQMADEQAVSAKLRAQVYELELTVAALRRQLINAGMELAPPLMRPSPDPDAV